MTVEIVGGSALYVFVRQRPLGVFTGRIFTLQPASLKVLGMSKNTGGLSAIGSLVFGGKASEFSH